MDKVTTIKASYTVDLKLQYLRVGDIVAFQRNDMSAFVDAAQFDELKNSKSSVAFIEGFEELDYFAYLPDSFMKKFMKSQGFRTEGGLHKMDEKTASAYKSQNAIRIISSKGFDPKRLFFFQFYDHTLWLPNEEFPVSIPLHMDYIRGGIDNQRYDLKKVMKILSSNPWVRDVEMIEIPYYNRDENRTHAIEFTVLFPQCVHDGLCKFNFAQVGHRDDSYRGSGIMNVSDVICATYDGFPDVLKLRKARREDEEG